MLQRSEKTQPKYSAKALCPCWWHFGTKQNLKQGVPILLLSADALLHCCLWDVASCHMERAFQDGPPHSSYCARSARNEIPLGKHKYSVLYTETCSSLDIGTLLLHMVLVICSWPPYEYSLIYSVCPFLIVTRVAEYMAWPNDGGTVAWRFIIL